MQFISKNELELKNGGYLYGKGSPVTNADFVNAQILAHKVVTLADIMKGKNTKGTKPYTAAEAWAELNKRLAKQDVEYVKVVEPYKGDLNTQLEDEALKFVDQQIAKDNAVKVNKYMQNFNVLNDFEGHGLFFTEGQVKLEKIYTKAEITDAVAKVINIL